MSEAATVRSEIETFVRARFEIGIDDPDFSHDIHLFDYGYVDSFGAQELIAHIEATYQIKIGNDDLVKFPMNTLDEISRFVVERRAGVR